MNLFESNFPLNQAAKIQPSTLRPQAQTRYGDLQLSLAQLPLRSTFAGSTWAAPLESKNCNILLQLGADEALGEILRRVVLQRERIFPEIAGSLRQLDPDARALACKKLTAQIKRDLPLHDAEEKTTLRHFQANVLQKNFGIGGITSLTQRLFGWALPQISLRDLA